jgi:hypothetical protein
MDATIVSASEEEENESGHNINVDATIVSASECVIVDLSSDNKVGVSATANDPTPPGHLIILHP